MPGVTTARAAAPAIVDQPYQGEEDFWRVRNLLIEAYPLTPVDFNWEVRRWDGNFAHRADPGLRAAGDAAIRLWETGDGRLIGAAHPEGPGDAFFELHPDYRQWLEEDMVAWAEENLSVPAEEPGRRKVETFVFDYDTPRRRLLALRGWQEQSWGGASRRLRIGNLPLPDPCLAEGYLLDTTHPGDEAMYQKMADILNAGFNRTIHTAAEYRNFVALCPCFRHDLNLVAVAPDGTYAAHVGVNFIVEAGYAVFEPVSTHPAHRRRNLARSLMWEGLRRVKALGARDAYVGTGDALAANELYDAVGFTECYRGRGWRKLI